MRHRLYIKIFAAVMAAVGFLGCFLCAYGHVRFIAVGQPPMQSNKKLAPEKTDFKVAVFGDFGMQTGVAGPIMQRISASDADIVICTGDMFRHPNIGSAFYLRGFFKKNLSKPYFCAAGNHDTDEGGHSLFHYRLFAGDEQYFFGYGDTLFIVLNTADAAFDEERLAYLGHVLKKLRADYRRCILVTHTPPVEYDRLPKYENRDLAELLPRLGNQFRINGMICGHYHIAEKLDFNGIPVYISHTTGQKNRDKQHPQYGYLTLHFKTDGSIEEKYHFVPELVRSRNYLHGFILEKIFDDVYWFCGSFLLLLTGLTALIIFCFQKEKSEQTVS